MKAVDIKIGQIWKDKDRRREQEGTVRYFTVVGSIGEGSEIQCRPHDHRSKKAYYFRRERFGSGSAHDSFALVSQP